MKKYEIMKNQKMEWFGRTLYRIRRLSDGVIGGWVESEENLSQEGQCFITDDAKVYDKAKVYEHALVFGRGQVCGHAMLFGEAQVSEYISLDQRRMPNVYGNAQVYGRAKVYRGDKVHGNAKVYDDARVCGHSEVCGDADVFGFSLVYGVAIATVPVLFREMPRHEITVTDKHIGVGCEIHTFDHWEKNIEEIGKHHFYSPEEIEMYREAIFGMISERRAQGF